MEIKKVNDHQIRCTLTKEDLAEKQITIEELKYGDNKAAALFDEISNYASEKWGFNEEDWTLMVEAIPLALEGLLLIITAVENPEEVVPIYAHFAPYKPSSSQPDSKQDNTPIESSKPQRKLFSAVFAFSKIDDVVLFAKTRGIFFKGTSNLYLNEDSHTFYLSLTRFPSMDQDSFLDVINSAMEFGRLVKHGPLLVSYLEEHFTPVMAQPMRTICKAFVEKNPAMESLLPTLFPS